mgnify:CR=1 FL=1
MISESYTLTNSFNYKYFKELYEDNVTSVSFSFKSANSLNDEDIKLFNESIDENDKETIITTNRNSEPFKFRVKIRIDTAMEWNYFLNDGILNYVLKNIASSA